MKKGISKERIAARAAREVKDGMYVNVGYGIPNLVPEYLVGRDIFLHTENGIIGMGPLAKPGCEDPDIVNAAKQPVTIVPGGALVSQSDSFMIIRGGHLAMTFLGAFQVSEKGTWPTGRCRATTAYRAWAGPWTWRRAPRTSW